MVPTQDHDLIRHWAQRCGAKPAQLRRLKYDGSPAILTFVFGDPDGIEPNITPISWEMFFAEFDLMGLSMSWHDDTPMFDIVKVEKRPTDGLSN